MISFKEPPEQDLPRLQRLRRKLSEKGNSSGLMSLFYRYIEMPDVVNPQLKSHAFTYWGDYFSSLMFAFWGILAALVALAIAIADPPTSWLRAGIATLAILLLAINLHSIMRGKTFRRQFEIPETQIAEIHRNASDRLLDDLRNEGFFLNGA